MFSSKNQFLTGAGGYQIQRSVRFRSSATAYLTRTYTTPTNNKIFTWSAWIKRGLISSASGGTTYYRLLSSNTNTDEAIRFSSDALQVFFNGTTSGNIQTTQLFRDTSAWYHVVVAVDTTQATAANRVLIYVNGLQVTAFSTASYPAQNYTTSLNAAGSVYTSCAQSLIEYFDGYIAENNFIDGQQLTPSSFGQTDPVTGVWRPLKYTGTYGTNGFYLNFSDNSASTATTIGKDYSGNGNNWTPNNISVTAGVTYDSMLDSPTPYADGGNGRGNYPVWNSLTAGGLVTFSEANLKALSTSAAAPYNIETTMKTTTGKWYAEVTIAAGASNPLVGIGNNPATSASNTDQYACYRTNATYATASMGASSSGTPATFTTGDVIGIAFDADAGTLVFYKNGTLQSGGFTGITAGNYSFVVRKDSASGDGGYLNCGQRPFTYTPPTGFIALNTQNLPTPAISNGLKHFNTGLWAGTGAAQNITLNPFQPDFIWLKARSTASYGHYLTDAVRGVTKYVSSHDSSVEATATDLVTAITTDGFTLGTSVVGNASGQTYAGWLWNAGGSTVTNTTGSISAQVRANATAGFSIVTYTGTGANATVGHGLGVAPKMIFIKNRSSVQDWLVYNSIIGATNYLSLNLTIASTVGSTPWNNTAPTSSVFSLGTAAQVNLNTSSFVAYCFSEVAGYSKFGSYTGTNAADGPFVYFGFRPKFILIKRTDAVENWTIWDTSRNTYNATTTELYPNLAIAEANGGGLAFLSNGMKVTSVAGTNYNTNGATYIYMAFAENPFKYSLAR